MSKIDYAALANAAAETDDQTETRASFDFQVAPEGPGVARFVGYIETGNQPRKAFAGKEKKPAPGVILFFDLLSPKNIREHEGNTYCDRIKVELNKLLDGKAGYKKLFNTMSRGRENIKHMAQMLNEPFSVKVVHSKSKDGTRTYANLRDENGTWFINAPVAVDNLAGTQTDLSHLIPPAISPIKIFVWDRPTQETWDSLFIDGTYTRKNKEGVEEEVSKNWLQSRIVSATDFQGSALEALLGGMPDLPMAETDEQPPVNQGNEEPAPEPETPAEEDDEEAALLKQLAAAKAKKAAAAKKAAEKAPEPAKIAPPKVVVKPKATKGAPKAEPASKAEKAPVVKANKPTTEKAPTPSAADALKMLGLG